MLKKICELSEFKLHDDDSGSFEGYASTFGNFDRAGEAVVKGAFAKTLSGFKANGFIAVGHDWGSLPVATISEAYEDAKGLFIKGHFHSTPEAQNARTVVKERLERGKSVGLSIGYEVKDAEIAKGGRLLKELDLYETSIVPVPCNQEASATGAKHAPAAEFKAQYLGDYVEGSMTLAALRRLEDALFYGVVYGCLFEDQRPLAERLDTLRGAFDEFRDIALRAIDALMQGADGAAAEPDDLEAEFMGYWPKPETKTGVPFDQQLTAAIAAVTACQARAGDVAEMRAKQGRTLSADRRTQIGQLKDALSALLEPAVETIGFDPAELDLAALRVKSRERVARLLGLDV